MTSYPRFDGYTRSWESAINPRKWLYQTPADILIKASNGASDFGNKFGAGAAAQHSITSANSNGAPATGA